MPKPSKNKTNEFRDENFKFIDSIHYLCTEQGLALMGFGQELGQWHALYFNKRKMKEPVLAECRDEQDYHIRFSQWMTICTEKSRGYPTFSEMVTGEIERLKRTYQL